GAGILEIAEHDFVQAGVERTFDVVINCRAFQGLPADSMRAAARNFRAALRAGGACILDTMNVQGEHRDAIEDAMEAAGFYLPFRDTERWYRQRLAATGVPYMMILGRPIVRPGVQSEARGQAALDAHLAEYERRRALEAPVVEAKLARPETVAAHVVYATG